ncbi:MAG: hypothetical protein ACRC1M_07335 [Methanobacteriaceae archaeon]
MKRITITVKESMDLIFRKLASKKHRFKRGWYSKSMAEAMNLWAENELKLVKLDDLAIELWEQVKKNTNSEIVTCDDVIKSVEDFFTKQCVYTPNTTYSYKEGNLEVATNLRNPNEILKFVTNNDFIRNTTIDGNEYTSIETFNSPFVLAIKAGIEEVTNNEYELDRINYYSSGKSDFRLKLKVINQ